MNDFPRCESCTYADDVESPADTALGKWLICRRRAPFVFSKAKDGFAGGWGVFPRVERTDWCGEWVQDCINAGEPEQTDFLTRELEIFIEDEEEAAEKTVLK